MSSSSSAPQSHPSVSVLSDVFETEKEDTKKSLCTEVGLLADTELDSLILKITQQLVTNKKLFTISQAASSSSSSSSSASPKQCLLNVAELRRVLEVEKEAAKVAFRGDLHRRVEPVVDSLFKRLTNKSMELDLARLDSVNGGGGECAESVLNPTTEQSATSGGSTRRVKSVPLGPVCNCPNPHPHVELHPKVKVEVKEEEKEEIPTRKSKTPKSKSRKRKGTATTGSEVSTPGPMKRSKRTRVPREADRTETVQQVSTAVDERQVHQQNGRGGGLGQTDDEDDETEFGEEDQGGHFKIAIIKLKCTENGCEKEVASRDELHDHLLDKHHILPYGCLAEGCNERFEHWGQLGSHIRDNHSNISTWSCAYCTKTFKSQRQLYQHLYFYHFEGQFMCGYDGCHDDQVATLRFEIKSHQQSAHPSAIFTCRFNDCGKTFKQQSNFDRHQLVHTGVKPFYCDWIGCGKSFAQKGNLDAHVRAHQKVKAFNCTWKKCAYASTEKSAVIKHIRTRHFHLPATQKEQQQLRIVDKRDPRDYVRMD